MGKNSYKENIIYLQLTQKSPLYLPRMSISFQSNQMFSTSIHSVFHHHIQPNHKIASQQIQPASKSFCISRLWIFSQCQPWIWNNASKTPLGALNLLSEKNVICLNAFWLSTQLKKYSVVLQGMNFTEFQIAHFQRFKQPRGY